MKSTVCSSVREAFISVSDFVIVALRRSAKACARIRIPRLGILRFVQASLVAGAALVAFAPSSFAVPIAYEMSVLGANGRFVYDRDSGVLSDFYLTISNPDRPTTWVFSDLTIYSGTHDGFSLSGHTTVDSPVPGHPFDAYLGSFQPWFELRPYPPVSFVFLDSSPDSGGTLYGSMFWWNPQVGGGVEHLDNRYVAIGEVGSVPESGSTGVMLLVGLGLVAWLRRNR